MKRQRDLDTATTKSAPKVLAEVLRRFDQQVVSLQKPRSTFESYFGAGFDCARAIVEKLKRECE